MDLFVSNIPNRFNQKQLESFLRAVFRSFDILAFSCEKLKNKTCARLVIYDASAGLRFLNTHGTPPGARNNTPPRHPLTCHGQTIKFRVNHHEKPDPLFMECLAKENAERQVVRGTKSTNQTPANARHTFQLLQPLHCGVWDYRDGHPFYQSCFQDARIGSLILGRKTLLIMQYANDHVPVTTRVNIPYAIIDSIALGSYSNPTVTFTLRQAPVFWDIRNEEDEEDPMVFRMRSASLTDTQRNGQKPSKIRVCGLNTSHNTTAASCLVYRVTITDPAQLNELKNSLNSAPPGPGCISVATSLKDYRRAFLQDLNILKKSLQDTELFGDLPFKMQFQLQRLAQNGYLNPRKVSKLLPSLQIMLKDFDEVALVEGLRSAARELPYPGPSADPSIFGAKSLLQSIRDKASAFTRTGSIYEDVKRHNHLGLIHKVNVTPAGTYLEGPFPEMKNRVLRKYPGFTDHFIRVTFTDEDFERIQNPFDVSSDVVFWKRFRGVLDDGVNIAGRIFIFLGFSHSSLRAQSCWFMSPFVQDGTLIHAQRVIEDLGDFSQFRSPAKCAARIGQTFSDATDSVKLTADAEQKIPDIERNGRTFTDGVGTISESLLLRIWNEFSRTRKKKATLLQIRYKGAKGMLALDPRLKGEKICLRPSMIKFEGSGDNNLEICGAGYKPLPMYLNRDFVKILEDLGVPIQSFLDLQSKAVKQLYDIIQGPVNAARFLEVNRTGLGARIPSLIRQLNGLNIDFQQDELLLHMVQLTALVQLRDMKYRARIPVEGGATLYGIADETGYLKEGEVYISTRNLDGTLIDIIGPVIVTRAPARHPGDVQVATAVKCPNRSPLAKLHNCIVFSQHGSRDLPSQLSGGDLDGDLFQIIYDEKTLWPRKIAIPADYPRAKPVDIGRPVEAKHIIEFFLTFMQTDQLGRICNTHTQVADQKEEGTFNPVCIELAEMASIAVDYSKTGIPVDLSSFPRNYQRMLKPDFMADGPRLIIDSEIKLQEEGQYEDDEPDAVSLLDPDSRRVRFYRSEKALGHLFRAIDETKFLRSMQNLAIDSRAASGSDELPMDTLWTYIRRTTSMIQWEHHRTLARKIREAYEENLHDTMMQYSPHPKEPLSELEVFCGTILGKHGNLPSHRLRDAGFDMKDKFERDVAWTMEWIKHGDVDPNAPGEEEDEEYDGITTVAIGGINEALERSLACLAVAMKENGKRVHGVGVLKSFKYVAAGVCLREVERFKHVARMRR